MAEFRQLRRGKEASFYSQVEKEGSSSLMVLSDEMSPKFQSLLSLKYFKSFTGPIYFDILLGERSGTVPMYLPEAEGPLFPSCFPWCDRHSHVQLSSNCRAMRPEGAQLHQPPVLQSSLSQQHFQRHQRQLPGQRMQLDTSAAQHGADNQWRKGEMWQK